MKLIKDYDYTIHYYMSKTNVVANALSRKSSAYLSCLIVGRKPLLNELKKMNFEFMVHETCALLAQLKVKPTLIDKIKERQFSYPQLVKISEEVKNGDCVDFNMGEDDIFHFVNWLCVPNIEGLERKILIEAHGAIYIVYFGSTKMYKYLNETYWWCNMKNMM